MALFVNRPQFDDELPALPGEPLRPELPAGHLSPPTTTTAGLGLLDDTVESIAIPLDPA